MLVLLPLVALGAIGAPAALMAHRRAVQAQAASAEVPALVAVDNALAAVQEEMAEADMAYYAERSGFALAFVDRLMGAHLEQGITRARSRTDAAVGRLPAGLRRQVTALLAAGRRLGEGARPSAAVSFGTPYLGAARALGVQASANALRLRLDLLRGSASLTLVDALDALTWANQAAVVAAREVADNVPALVGAPAERRQSGLRLAQDMALEQEATSQVLATGDPQVVQALAAWQDDPATRAWRQLMLGAIAGERLPIAGDQLRSGPGTVNLAVMVAAVEGAPTQRSLVAKVLSLSAQSVAREASALVSSSQRSYELWLGLVSLGALVTLALAFAVARSISRPLRRLARAAQAVVDGDLGTDELPGGGLAETAWVATAFNSLLGTLRLLDAKARALADCDFDNQVLTSVLPGNIGASLEDSVRVLQASIRDRHSLQQRLAYQVTHDSLTNLHNRAALVGSLALAMSRARRDGELTAVLYLDLDNFKQANDLHGHQAGDAVLRQVGERLAGAVGQADTLARIGGDEFVVVSERVSGPAAAEALARRLITALVEPFEWEGKQFSLGASVGVALAGNGDTAPLQLLTRADIALYQAKARGGNAVEMYDASLQARMAARDEVESELRSALAHDGAGLELHYQPVLGREGAVYGFEALVRWQRPGHGLTYPDQFIPVAEASDLIIDLDRWVQRTAVAKLAEWSADPLFAGLNLAVNVSRRHLLRGGLDAYLRQLLAAVPVRPDLLTVEITETVLLDDVELMADELAKVRGLGVLVAVDDYGTGYTSPLQLRMLPVNSVKVDRSYVAKLGDAKDGALVGVMTQLAHQLGLEALSEGVETVEQLEAVRALGIDRVQGYLLGRPMPVGDLRDWLTRQQARPEATGLRLVRGTG